MAKKYKDVLGLQLRMLERVLDESDPRNAPMTRKASRKSVVNPKTGVKYVVVG